MVLKPRPSCYHYLSNPQNSSRIIILARYGTLSLTSVLEYLNNYADYACFVERSEVVSLGKTSNHVKEPM
jgi:hypothetical protein